MKRLLLSLVLVAGCSANRASLVLVDGKGSALTRGINGFAVAYTRRCPKTQPCQVPPMTIERGALKVTVE